MDLKTIHDELVSLRKDIRAYHNATIQNKTDIVWIKKAVVGAFALIFGLVSHYVKTLIK